MRDERNISSGEGRTYIPSGRAPSEASAVYSRRIRCRAVTSELILSKIGLFTFSRGFGGLRGRALRDDERATRRCGSD